jgi:hypothetical protein
MVIDHEHPCPSTACRDDLRRQGYDLPDDMECCICWKQQHAPELLVGPLPPPYPPAPDIAKVIDNED